MSPFTATHTLRVTNARGHTQAIPVRVEDERGQLCEPVAGARLVTEYETEQHGCTDWAIDETGPWNAAGLGRPAAYSLDRVEVAS